MCVRNQLILLYKSIQIARTLNNVLPLLPDIFLLSFSTIRLHRCDIRMVNVNV